MVSLTREKLLRVPSSGHVVSCLMITVAFYLYMVVTSIAGNRIKSVLQSPPSEGTPHLVAPSCAVDAPANFSFSSLALRMRDTWDTLLATLSHR